MHYGLDFGTSNSVISFFDGQKVRLLPIDDLAPDPMILRSVLYFRKNLRHFVGEEAVRMYIKDNQERLPAKKIPVFTGKTIPIEIDDTAGSGGTITYQADLVVEVDVNKPGQFLQALKTSLREDFSLPATIFEEEFHLEQLISLILKFMKNQGDKVIGRSIENVILGRPVHYLKKTVDDQQIEDRMRQAAQLAGFKKIQFIPEPIAATFSYLQKVKSNQTILVFDFGGGTTDFCLMKYANGKSEILATEGLSIGGDLFNEEIMEGKIAKFFGTEVRWAEERLSMPAYIKNTLRRWYELQSLNDPQIKKFLQEVKRAKENREVIENLETLIDYDLGFSLFEAIEKAKITLSNQNETLINFSDKGINIREQITREEFEEMIGPYIAKIEETIQQVLEKGKIKNEKTDRVICTGGSSQIPLVQKMLQENFGPEKIVFHDLFTGVGTGLAWAGTE